MKKHFKTVSVILAIVLLTFSSTAFSKKYSKKSEAGNYTGITYLVKVTSPACGELCQTYIVVIRNDNGDPVGPALLYNEGISNYIFHENGPVTGTRVACLERIIGSGGPQCNQVLNTSPDGFSGELRNGSLYIFNLQPSLIERVE